MAAATTVFYAIALCFCFSSPSHTPSRLSFAGTILLSFFLSFPPCLEPCWSCLRVPKRSLRQATALVKKKTLRFSFSSFHPADTRLASSWPFALFCALPFRPAPVLVTVPPVSPFAFSRRLFCRFRLNYVLLAVLLPFSTFRLAPMLVFVQNELKKCWFGNLELSSSSSPHMLVFASILTLGGSGGHTIVGFG